VAPSSRIPTPLKQHLHRFRLGLLPAMSFIFCVAFTLWLWHRQGVTGTVLGEIEAAVVDVAAGIEGELKTPPGGHYWELFDTVKVGQPIAYLDDRLILARMETVRRTAEQLQAELNATQVEFELQQADSSQQYQSDLARLQFEVERRQVARLQQLAAVKALEAEMNDFKAHLDMLDNLQARGQFPGLSLVDEMDVREVRREYNARKAEYAISKPLVDEMSKQYHVLKKQLETYPPMHLAEVDAVLEPIRKEELVQYALLQEIQVELDDCVIKSPIDGVISTIWRYPGQRVAAADPIVTIARPDSNYVVGYVREQQRIPLYEGMEVGLRLSNQPNSPEYTSSVEAVSPQVSPLPLRRLADQNIMEFATWIKIPIPTELKEQQEFRPGQRVQVIFRSPRRTQ
jgi:multidrug resistance efflux pump